MPVPEYLGYRRGSVSSSGPNATSLVVVSVSKGNDGTLSVAVPITSQEYGTEGTLTFTLTEDMRLRIVWDGVGLTDFQAWSTQ